MPCTCCETGRCCDGATCLATTTSECVYRNGSFTTGATCASQICISPSGAFACSSVTPCKCDSDGGTVLTVTSCDCNAIKSAGYTSGGCQTQYCEVCSATTGACVNTCPATRECCYGVCCPVQQYCSGGVCTNLCAAGTTFCNFNNPSYLEYDCCASGTKCCGASGCLPSGSVSFSVNVAVDAWVDTGVTVASGDAISITASSLTAAGAAGPVQWGGAGSTATPAGVTSAACNCCDGASVSASFCHMRLIGRIGLSGTIFSVGTSYSGSPGAGRLYLRQNDTVVSDNAGSFVGTISGIDPCPGYTPSAIGEPIVYAAGEEPPTPLPGPGTALKSLLRLAGIVASPTCSCNARAAQMDTWGEWGCLKRIPEICGWLKEEAAKRKLWFFPPAGVALILAAISLSALKRPWRGNNR